MCGRWVRWLLGMLSVLAIVGFGQAASASAASTTGEAYVLQGLVGVTAQVSVDGAVVAASAAPKTVVGPLRLAPGQHVVELRSSDSPLVSAKFSIAAGDSLDVVAHAAADAAMTPTITVFRNDLSPVGPGKARLVVSHVAVAEPADIRLDGKPMFRNVANGESLSVVVPAKAYSLDLVSTATGTKIILAPVRVTPAAGTLTRVFVIGSPDKTTVDTVVQVLKVQVVGADAPRYVHTGDGGQAATELSTPSATPSAGLIAAAALGFLAVGLVGAVRGSTRSLQTSRSKRAE